MSTETQNIIIQKIAKSKISEVDFSNLAFGSVFTDHMYVCDFKDGEWQTPTIKPYGPISIDPSAKVFHYGQAVFEGMKAYKAEDDSIWMFRPEENQKRINFSANRLQMPSFPKEMFFDGLETLLKLDRDWIQKGEGNSMYIRPFVIATESGVSASPSKEYKFMFILSPAQSYFKGGGSDVKVLFADKYSRSANGGVGAAKAAGNYAGQFYPTHLAQEQGYQQVVWTDANTHEFLEEAGVMNVFFRVGDTLLTAPTSDRILDGITRKSIIQVAQDMGISVEVRNVRVSEIVDAAKNGTLLEMFGAGTAAVINPIAGFGCKGEDYTLPKLENSYAMLLRKRITDIQTNKAEDKHGWRYKVKE
ncbi:branched-chain amino acid aminotransferase [Urechidicola croceus]|uniref:Branched-chain-amino-acid aminotransferase n=1 Tax=Urechidicola croceus TaxID=1850246 RepID=A0A1D8P7F7_9FLAO|nr:branched-chain amino acid aminotransferase [Urechidicola croceus]AOW20515.1 branched chain amino acid aminotransferase [Urechidicola croceus]